MGVKLGILSLLKSGPVINMVAFWGMRCIVSLKYTDVSEVLTVSIIRAMMEAVSTSQMLAVSTRQRRNIPQVNQSSLYKMLETLLVHGRFQWRDLVKTL
jgi:hypothetical protein